MPFSTMLALTRFLLLYRADTLSWMSGGSDGATETPEIWDADLAEDGSHQFRTDVVPRSLGFKHHRWQRGASALRDVFENVQNVSKYTGRHDVRALHHSRGAENVSKSIGQHNVPASHHSLAAENFSKYTGQHNVSASQHSRAAENFSKYTGQHNDSASHHAQENVSENSSSMCKGCDITIDLRCGGLRCRHAFFHRVTDCLLPSFGLLTKAREVKGRRCILTWSNDNEVDILPLLAVLADDLQARIIPEDAECVEGMDVWSPLRRYDYVPHGPVPHWSKLPHPNIVGRVKIDRAANVRALIADAARHLGRGQQRVPTLVLVLRRHPERSFTHETEKLLKRMLEKVAGSAGASRHLGWGPWRHAAADVQTEVYLGEEKMLDTMRMFGNAAGVLGYHGASFVNALFADHPVCIEEITTFADTDGSQIWRTNDKLSETNTFLIWQKFVVQLQSLIDANRVQEEWDVAPDKDQFIKRFSRIYLSAAHVIQLERQLVNCLENNVFLM